MTTETEFELRQGIGTMRVFFDFEFTGLHQTTTPISFGMVSENGYTFYAEFNNYNPNQLTGWMTENVLPNLRFNGITRSVPLIDNEHYDMKGDNYDVKTMVEQWLSQFDSVEMWGDCLSYDWVLFCELFEGGAFGIPKNVYYIPFDIATLMKIKISDPDINREEFCGLPGNGKHNALHDAKVIKACFDRLSLPD